MKPYTHYIEEAKKLATIFSEILNPGASDREAELFIKEMPLQVPVDFIEFYKAVNGSRAYEFMDIEGMCFLSLERVLSKKKMFDEILAEKKAGNEFFCWHPDWFPFADDYSYDTLAIDTTGKGTGRKGCVLKRSKDSFEEDTMCIVAPDFDTFVESWIRNVRGEKVYLFGVKDSEGKNEPADPHYYSCFEQVPLTDLNKK